MSDPSPLPFVRLFQLGREYELWRVTDASILDHWKSSIFVEREIAGLIPGDIDHGLFALLRMSKHGQFHPVRFLSLDGSFVQIHRALPGSQDEDSSLHLRLFRWFANASFQHPVFTDISIGTMIAASGDLEFEPRFLVEDDTEIRWPLGIPMPWTFRLDEFLAWLATSSA